MYNHLLFESYLIICEKKKRFGIQAFNCLDFGQIFCISLVWWKNYCWQPAMLGRKKIAVGSWWQLCCCEKSSFNGGMCLKTKQQEQNLLEKQAKPWQWPKKHTHWSCWYVFEKAQQCRKSCRRLLSRWLSSARLWEGH